MERVLLVDPDKCTACRICELACSAKHTGAFNPAKSRITVETFLEDNFFFPLVCQHCENAPCIEVCPTGSLTRNPDTQAVVVDESKCIGCRMCQIACPFGAVGYSASERKIVKCDLCGGEPECVTFCPWQAITLIEADDAVLAKRRAFGARLKEAMKEVKV